MILGDPNAASVSAGSRTTLDNIFQSAAARRPDAIALADPPNRASFTDGAPRRLTYAQADRMVTAIAGRLRRLGLATDAVIGLQLPNTIESVLMLLGVMRAGMIATPLPLLWRRADAVAALSRLGARAIVTSARVGGLDHCELAMQVGAEIFAIRYVCGFGDKLADGMIPFDDLFTDHTPDPVPPLARDHNPAAHVALVTWEVTPDGLVPVARNHLELISGGLAVMLEAGIEPDAAILSTCPASSFAGIALTVLPWLLTGGTLSLHQPFDPAVFAAQCNDDRCTTVILPGPLVPRLLDAGLLSHAGLINVLAVWRAPERLMASPAWGHPSARLTDVLVFGETALLGSRRDSDGRPAPIPLGVVNAPRDAAGAVPVAELTRSGAGTVALRGPMVPRHAFPPGAERTAALHFKADAGGLVDTGYACRVERETRAMVVTGPPPGLISVGGYRFALGELQDLVSRADPGATLAVLPDALAGHRLAGNTADRDTLQSALAGLGINPLVADAFRNRRRQAAAA